MDTIKTSIDQRITENLTKDSEYSLVLRLLAFHVNMFNIWTITIRRVVVLGCLSPGQSFHAAGAATCASHIMCQPPRLI